MVKLDHPGIVRYNHSWSEEPTEEWQRETDKQMLKKMGQTSKQSINFDESNLCNSSLEAWLSSNKTQSSRSLPRMKMWFKQMCSAVAYIHDKNLFHRDLKPSNILIFEEDKLKLCDLGIAALRTVDDEMNSMMNRTNCGTPLYKSPEQHYKAPYSSKTDVFSLGLILAEICVAMTSSERSKNFDLYRLGRKTNLVAERCPEAAEFVLWLAQKQYKRPTCREVLAHQFLAGTACAYCTI